MTASRNRLLLALLPLAAIPACTTTSEGLSVAHKGSSARGPFVVLSDGARAGLKAGDSVCFTGEGGEELGCGTVEKVKAGAAGVNLSPEVAAKVGVGAAAKARPQAAAAVEGDGSGPADADPGTGSPAEPPADEGEPPPDVPAPVPRAEKPEPADEGEPIEPADPKAAAPTARVELQYVLGLKQPVTYNGAGFAYKSRTDRTIATWQSTRKVDQASFGLKLAFHKPLTGKLGIAPSFYYFLNDDIASKGAFDSTAPRSSLSSLTVGDLKGLAVDADYAVYADELVGVFALAGLGVFSSTVTVDATLYDSIAAKTYKVAAYESYVHALTGNLDAKVQLRPWKGLILTLDALLFAPLATLAHGDSGYVDFTAGDFGVADYRLAAMRAGVDHKAAGLAYGAAFGGGWQF